MKIKVKLKRKKPRYYISYDEDLPIEILDREHKTVLIRVYEWEGHPVERYFVAIAFAEKLVAFLNKGGKESGK